MVARRRLATQPKPQVVEDDVPEMEAALEQLAPKLKKGSIPRSKLHTEARTDERPAQHMPDHDRPRTRRRSSLISDNIYHIPIDEIPEGSSYEWKRWTVMGMEDPFYIAQMREQGWEPVNPKRHPNWVPPDYNQPYIIKGGQILMERPIELTQEARRENRQLAKRQVVEAEQRLGMTPKDTLSRQHPDIKNRIVKEIGRMVQVEE